MIKKADILKTIEHDQDILKNLGVKTIGVFGSFVHNRQTNKSDIDILVEFQKGKKTFDNYMNVKEVLTKRLKRNIDLVIKESLKPRIKPAILNSTSYARL